VFRVEALTEGGGIRKVTEPYVGTSIALYEYPDGFIVGIRHASWRREDVRFGGGPEFTQRIRKTFRESALRDFDFEKCVAEAKRKMGSEGNIVGYVGFPTLRFYADLEGTVFSFTAEAVRGKVDQYAKYNASLLRLKIVLDEIACELGRTDEVASVPNQSPEETPSARKPAAGAPVMPAFERASS
jgi:hypothetical protein